MSWLNSVGFRVQGNVALDNLVAYSSALGSCVASITHWDRPYYHQNSINLRIFGILRSWRRWGSYPGCAGFLTSASDHFIRRRPFLVLSSFVTVGDWSCLAVSNWGCTFQLSGEQLLSIVLETGHVICVLGDQFGFIDLATFTMARKLRELRDELCSFRVTLSASVLFVF